MSGNTNEFMERKRGEKEESHDMDCFLYKVEL